MLDKYLNIQYKFTLTTFASIYNRHLSSEGARVDENMDRMNQFSKHGKQLNIYRNTKTISIQTINVLHGGQLLEPERTLSCRILL